MSEPLSDAEKVQSTLHEIRLAKLAANQDSTPTPSPQSPAPDASSVAESPSSAPAQPVPQQLSSEPVKTDSTPSPNPFAQLGLRPESAQPVQQQAPAPQRAQITITPLKREAERSSSRPRSRQGRPGETLEEWEDRTLGAIFRVTVKEDHTKDSQGNRLYYLEGLKSDLEDGSDGAPPRLAVASLDSAILEAASNAPGRKVLDYLLSCWKRVTRLGRTLRSSSTDAVKQNIVKEAKRLCMSYCIFAVTDPDMFGIESSDVNPLAEHLLVDPEADHGVCFEFLSEAVSRLPEDEGARDALVEAMIQCSRQLSKISMDGDFRPYMMALRNFVQHQPLTDALTKHEYFLPQDIAPQDIETNSFLGPFFRLSPLQSEVAKSYFMGTQSQPEGVIRNAQKSLRMALSTHQDELTDIVNCIVKSSKEPRLRLLDWFALAVNSNHKRRAIQVDWKSVSTDGFMINITTILDRLCEPFMDATFAKVDRIEVDYLRRSPRVNIKDETKINADQKTSDEFYAHALEGTNNFISEVFFLTVAAHHYGTEAANSQLSTKERQVKNLEKEIVKMEADRHKFVQNPAQLQMFDRAVKKYKDQVEQSRYEIRATQGVLLDEVTQARSMQLMRYVIVWLLRIASGKNLPKETLELPLPEKQPEVFRNLPEYFMDDIVDNFKFITRHMPWIITSTQCEELVMICITFLRNSEYIKNPYLKSGLVTILFHGVWPIPNRAKGVLGDLLNASPFAYKHLLHALMKFYIEAESTGTHTQFFDKFNIRYEIFQVIRCIWTNTVYRDNLATEARVNTEFFVRFVNLLLNDVTFVLDESFSAFKTIHDLTAELAAAPADMDQTVKQEKEEALAGAKSKAKGYMQLTNETVSMLKLFTEALADSFTKAEIVQRLADMLDYNLDALAGPKQKELKVENKEEYGWRPQEMLSDIMDVYLNLREKTAFHLAVARDGRSYRDANFTNAGNIMRRFALKSPEELRQWEALARIIAKTKEEDDKAEEDLGEIPDEFLDPLMFTLMEDPVILPKSKVTVDRSTIRSHLLSDPTDPFNRVPMTIEDVMEDTEMKAKIDAFKAERSAKKEQIVAEKMEDVVTAQPGGDPMDTS
ncbi:hypothetical protein NA57DRAFT_65398 [Rhizodiscina lignyota]|uniref:U-box domain-containing protein n=1 Tax=Rhizodiscina lignyota TaxID=1504668 RepID=A0A9P4IHH5_9PEZI|nr:hypothetical protein NA57DRAFT_65398 [Rhizodiscina lignyota]